MPPKKTSYYLVCLNYPFVVWDEQSALEDLRNAQTRAKMLGFELEGEFIPVYSTADSMTRVFEYSSKSRPANQARDRDFIFTRNRVETDTLLPQTKSCFKVVVKFMLPAEVYHQRRIGHMELSQEAASSVVTEIDKQALNKAVLKQVTNYLAELPHITVGGNVSRIDSNQTEKFSAYSNSRPDLFFFPPQKRYWGHCGQLQSPRGRPRPRPCRVHC